MGKKIAPECICSMKLEAFGDIVTGSLLPVIMSPNAKSFLVDNPTCQPLEFDLLCCHFY